MPVDATAETTAPEAADTSTDASQTTGDATGTNGGVDAKQLAKIFATEADFQAEVDRLLKDRLKRAETAAQDKARKEAEKAAEEVANKNGEWKDLADKRAATLALLELDKASLTAQAEAQSTKLSRYEKALNAHVVAQSADVPEGVKALLGKLDPVEQLEWIATNREALMQQRRQGVPPTPGADTNMTETQREAAQKSFGRLYTDF